MVCELNDKEAAALNVKSFMKSFGREVTYEKLARERGGAQATPPTRPLTLRTAACRARSRPEPLPAPELVANHRSRLRPAAGSSTVVISIERMDTLLHICATFRGGKYKQKVPHHTTRQHPPPAAPQKTSRALPP